MKCPNCEAENRDGAATCAQCGASLRRRNVRESLRRAFGSDATPRGRGRGGVATSIIVGVVLGIGLSLMATLVVTLFSHFVGQREKARSTSCIGNIKQLQRAALMYDQDYHQLPDGPTWCDELVPYTKSQYLFICPEDGGGPSDYAINSAVAGVDADTIAQPDAVVCIFDTTCGWNQHGGPSLVVNRHSRRKDVGIVELMVHRHSNGANFGFADGHSKWVPSWSASSYTWDLSAPSAGSGATGGP